ncbi:MAG TPA: hypothetical protein VN668_02425, partial [Stellaceae bacterium]|nr:hypothetical protein [Stellaceae bacterium]
DLDPCYEGGRLAGPLLVARSRPSPSLEAFAAIWPGWLPRMEARLELFVVFRRAARQEVVGAAGLHDLGRQEPEAGIWLKETAPGRR